MSARLQDGGESKAWEEQELDALRLSCPLALSRSELLGENVVLATPPAEMSVTDIVAAMEALKTRSVLPCVCMVPLGKEALAGTLVAASVPFVTSSGDTFIPNPLRSMPQKSSKRVYGRMSPAARQAFLWMAQRPWKDTKAGDLMEATDMPRTTAQRAMSELRDLTSMSVYVAGLTGRTIVCRVDNPRTFVDEGLACFGRVPVGRLCVPAEEVADLPLAGTSALATRSRLAAPTREVRACCRVRARSLTKEPPSGERELCEVLVMPYDPEPLATDGVVDLATMALTCDGSDLLVAASLGEALKEMPWLLAMA